MKRLPVPQRYVEPVEPTGVPEPAKTPPVKPKTPRVRKPKEPAAPSWRIVPPAESQAWQLAPAAVPGPPVPSTSKPIATADVAAERQETLSRAVEDFVHDYTSVKRVDAPIHELYQHLQKDYPDLSVAEFHDALESLHKDNRVRLGSWSGRMDQVPHPELAIERLGSGSSSDRKLMTDLHIPEERRFTGHKQPKQNRRLPVPVRYAEPGGGAGQSEQPKATVPRPPKTPKPASLPPPAPPPAAAPPTPPTPPPPPAEPEPEQATFSDPHQQTIEGLVEGLPHSENELSDFLADQGGHDRAIAHMERHLWGDRMAGQSPMENFHDRFGSFYARLRARRDYLEWYPWVEPTMLDSMAAKIHQEGIPGRPLAGWHGAYDLATRQLSEQRQQPPAQHQRLSVPVRYAIPGEPPAPQPGGGKNLGTLGGLGAHQPSVPPLPHTPMPAAALKGPPSPASAFKQPTPPPLPPPAPPPPSANAPGQAPATTDFEAMRRAGPEAWGALSDQLEEQGDTHQASTLREGQGVWLPDGSLMDIGTLGFVEQLLNSFPAGMSWKNAPAWLADQPWLPQLAQLNGMTTPQMSALVQRISTDHGYREMVRGLLRQHAQSRTTEQAAGNWERLAWEPEPIDFWDQTQQRWRHRRLPLPARYAAPKPPKPPAAPKPPKPAAPKAPKPPQGASVPALPAPPPPQPTAVQPTVSTAQMGKLSVPKFAPEFVTELRQPTPEEQQQTVRGLTNPGGGDPRFTGQQVQDLRREAAGPLWDYVSEHGLWTDPAAMYSSPIADRLQARHNMLERAKTHFAQQSSSFDPRDFEQLDSLAAQIYPTLVEQLGAAPIEPRILWQEAYAQALLQHLDRPQPQQYRRLSVPQRYALPGGPPPGPPPPPPAPKPPVAQLAPSQARMPHLPVAQPAGARLLPGQQGMFPGRKPPVPQSDLTSQASHGGDQGPPLIGRHEIDRAPGSGPPSGPFHQPLDKPIEMPAASQLEALHRGLPASAPQLMDYLRDEGHEHLADMIGMGSDIVVMHDGQPEHYPFNNFDPDIHTFLERAKAPPKYPDDNYPRYHGGPVLEVRDPLNARDRSIHPWFQEMPASSTTQQMLHRYLGDVQLEKHERDQPHQLEWTTYDSEGNPLDEGAFDFTHQMVQQELAKHRQEREALRAHLPPDRREQVPFRRLLLPQRYAVPPGGHPPLPTAQPAAPVSPPPPTARAIPTARLAPNQTRMPHLPVAQPAIATGQPAHLGLRGRTPPPRVSDLPHAGFGQESGREIDRTPGQETPTGPYPVPGSGTRGTPLEMPALSQLEALQRAAAAGEPDAAGMLNDYMEEHQIAEQARQAHEQGRGQNPWLQAKHTASAFNQEPGYQGRPVLQLTHRSLPYSVHRELHPGEDLQTAAADFLHHNPVHLMGYDLPPRNVNYEVWQPGVHPISPEDMGILHRGEFTVDEAGRIRLVHPHDHAGARLRTQKHFPPVDTSQPPPPPPPPPGGRPRQPTLGEPGHAGGWPYRRLPLPVRYAVPGPPDPKNLGTPQTPKLPKPAAPVMKPPALQMPKLPRAAELQNSVPGEHLPAPSALGDSPPSVARVPRQPLASQEGGENRTAEDAHGTLRHHGKDFGIVDIPDQHAFAAHLAQTPTTMLSPAEAVTLGNTSAHKDLIGRGTQDASLIAGRGMVDQRHGSWQSVLHHAANPSTAPVIAVRHQGKTILLDGDHRLMAAVLTNRPLPIKIVDLPLVRQPQQHRRLPVPARYALPGQGPPKPPVGPPHFDMPPEALKGPPSPPAAFRQPAPPRLPKPAPPPAYQGPVGQAPATTDIEALVRDLPGSEGPLMDLLQERGGHNEALGHVQMAPLGSPQGAMRQRLDSRRNFLERLHNEAVGNPAAPRVDAERLDQLAEQHFPEILEWFSDLPYGKEIAWDRAYRVAYNTLVQEAKQPSAPPTQFRRRLPVPTRYAAPEEQAPAPKKPRSPRGVPKGKPLPLPRTAVSEPIKPTSVNASSLPQAPREEPPTPPAPSPPAPLDRWHDPPSMETPDMPTLHGLLEDYEHNPEPARDYIVQHDLHDYVIDWIRHRNQENWKANSRNEPWPFQVGQGLTNLLADLGNRQWHKKQYPDLDPDTLIGLARQLRPEFPRYGEDIKEAARRLREQQSQ